MNRIFTIALLYFTGISLNNAQIDQVSVGQGYSQQAYYSLSTGEVETVQNDAWDIAFSASGQQDAGVFLNESVSFMSLPMQVFLADTDDWSVSITSTESFVDSVALHNPEANWTEGAMNTLKDPDSPLDYGWGAYNPQSNIVEGSKVFVVKKRDGSFIKLQIVSLVGGTYSFQIADLDGENEKTFEVDKNDVVQGLVHFSFDTEEMVAMPSAFDLIFQRYTTPLDAGDGTFIEYTVTGVLLAPGTQAVSADGVDPMSVSESDYSDQYSYLPTTIGHDWKSFDFQSGWIIDEDRTHFVKNSAGDIYQLTFFDFEGSSTGVTTLERTFLTSVSTVDELSSDLSIEIYPNPTTESFSILSDQTSQLNITIFNNSGRLIRNIIATPHEPILVNDLASGLYNVLIKTKDTLITKSLVVR